MARIVSTSTMMSTIMLVIAVEGGTVVYISSRRKKHSMRLNRSISLSWLALAFLAAWKTCQIAYGRETTEDTDLEENADACKNKICR